MKRIYRILSVVLVLSLVISNSLQVSARTVTKECAERNTRCYNELDNGIIQGYDCERRGNAAVLYFVPGVGEVLITATGIVIVAGVIVAVGSWTYNTAIKYFKEHTKNKRKSTHDKHTNPRPGRDSEKKKSKDKGWKKRK